MTIRRVLRIFYEILFRKKDFVVLYIHEDKFTFDYKIDGNIANNFVLPLLGEIIRDREADDFVESIIPDGTELVDWTEDVEED